MSLIVKVPNATFTKPMPKLYRDAVINAGTQYLYDALNAVSYPRQGAPANGNPSADKWANLVTGTADGNLYSPSGDITWGASGGFVSPSGPSDKIAALANVTPGVLTKCLGIVWFKHTASASASDMLACFADMLNLTHNNGTNRFVVGCNGSAPITLALDTTTQVGLINQFGVAYDNATRTLNVYRNGALYATGGGYQDLQAPTRPHTLMQATGFGSAYQGTFYRWMFDALTGGKTADQIVALDYALNNGRFA